MLFSGIIEVIPGQISDTVSGSTRLGGLIGYSAGGSVNSYIDNCQVRGSITFKGDNAKFIGGVLGNAAESGSSQPVIVTNTYFEEGSVSVKGSSPTIANNSIGGFCGHSTNNNLTFYKCGSLAGVFDIDLTGSYLYAGGFISQNAGGTISNCYSHVNILTKHESINTNSSNYIGGFAGYNYGTIEKCYAAGTVRAVQISNPTSLYIGGLVGENMATIRNCYALGHVLADKRSGVGAVYAGGLVGQSSTNSIDNCYSTGQVTAQSLESTAYSGGLIGYRQSGTITNTASLGAKVLASATSPVAGRIAGSASAGLTGNSANELMRIGTGTYNSSLDYRYGDISYIMGLIAGTVATTDNTATGMNGADATTMNFMSSAYWQTTLGFSSTIWDFSTPALYRGYPLLVGLPGQQ